MLCEFPAFSLPTETLLPGWDFKKKIFLEDPERNGTVRTLGDAVFFGKKGSERKGILPLLITRNLSD